MSCDAGAANRGSNPVAPTRLGILLGQFHLLAIVTLGPLITVAAKPRRRRPRLDHQTITIDSYTTSIFFLVGRRGPGLPRRSAERREGIGGRIQSPRLGLT